MNLSNILVLRLQAKEVTFPLSEEVLETIDDIQDLIVSQGIFIFQRYVDGFWAKKAVAASAPQVGKNLRIFLICNSVDKNNKLMLKKKFTAFINPEITSFSFERIMAWEGCLSYPDEMALVERPKEIMFEGYTVDGVLRKVKC